MKYKELLYISKTSLNVSLSMCVIPMVKMVEIGFRSGRSLYVVNKNFSCRHYPDNCTDV